MNNTLKKALCHESQPASTSFSKLIKPIPAKYSEELLFNNDLQLQKQQKNLRVKRLYFNQIHVIHLDLHCPKKNTYPSRNSMTISKRFQCLKYSKNLLRLEILEPWTKIINLFLCFPTVLHKLKKLIINVGLSGSKLKKVPDKYKFPRKITFKALPMNTCLHIDPRSLENGLRFPITLTELTFFDLELKDSILTESTLEDSVQKMNKLVRLKTLNIILPHQKCHRKIFDQLNLKNLQVSLFTNVDFFRTIRENINEFIKRTGSKVKLYLKNCPHEDYFDVLSLLANDNNIISFPRLAYSFHQLIEFQTCLSSYFAMALISIEVMIISFELNSTNWFSEERKEIWKRIADLLVKRCQSPNLFRIIYKITFDNTIPKKETLYEMIKEVASFLQFNTSDQELHFPYIEIHMQIGYDKTIFGFAEFVERALKPLKKIMVLTCDISVNNKNSHHEEIISILRSLHEKNLVLLEPRIIEEVLYHDRYGTLRRKIDNTDAPRSYNLELKEV